MKKFIHQVLAEHCPAYAEDIQLQQKGQLDPGVQFLWQSLFVNSKNPQFAETFTTANPHCADAELAKLEEFIASAADSGHKPTCCRTFGCNEEQIALCQKKLFKNTKGEASNSPAYFIREESLQAYAAQEAFETIKDETFEKIASGDMTAHMEEDFLQAAADLKARNPSAFARLKEELEGLRVKLTAFNEEIGKRKKTTSKKNVETEAIEVPEHLKPYSDGADPGTSYVDEHGHIIALIQTREDAIPIQASNFVARVKEVREFDDGVDTAQQFVLDGYLNGEMKLPDIILPAEHFRFMNWPEKYWGNVLITSAPKARDVVRETIQRVSVNAPRVKVHYTLGWKKIGDKWCYLYSGGAVGGENVAVAEIHELQGYYFKEYPYTIEECAATVQTFLDIANHEITIPLLAHTFLSVMIEKLKQEEIEPRYLVWVYGVSGSFKTALMVVLINFFDSFGSPPATFNDTAAALEKKSYLTKDSLLLVDDFHPSASPNEAKMKASVANGLTRRYGDRITRSRSKSNLTLAKDYPPRGNLICTSEDLLIGHSTNSRHMGIEIHRGEINPDMLTVLQNNKEHLACFMTGFILYVAEHIMNTDTAFKERFLAHRAMSQNSNHHKRFAEAIACLQIGWETFLDYLKHIGHIDEDRHKAYFDEGFGIFQNLAVRQNDLVQNDDIADKFMSALKEMLDTKLIAPIDRDAPSTLHKGSVICYEDEDNYYFIPQSTYALVCDFFLRRGDLLNINEYMLRKMLADRKYLVTSSDGDGHKTCKIKIGERTIRVLQITKAVLNTF